MSSHICRAMGYGMAFEKFEELCILPKHKDGVGESIYETFSKLTDADLTIDDNVTKVLMYNGGPRPPHISEPRLLWAENKVGHATELYELVSPADGPTDIIFFPNLYFKTKWYHWDDDLDYAFERYTIEEDRFVPRDVVKYTKFGYYPFSYDIMDLNGNPLNYDYHGKLGLRNDWVPGIPSEIRWYLTQFDIMLHEDVNQLRPLIAQWWD